MDIGNFHAGGRIGSARKLLTAGITLFAGSLALGEQPRPVSGFNCDIVHPRIRAALAAPAAEGASSERAAAVVGTRRTLMVLVLFEGETWPGGEARVRARFQEALAKARAYWADTSQGRFQMEFTVVPESIVMPLSSRDGEFGYSVSNASLDAFTAAVWAKVRAYDASVGGNGRYLPERYDHESVVYKSIGVVGGRAESPGRKSWFFDSELRLPSANIVHEFGHNLGLPHASRWAPTTSDPIGPGSRSEYGNEADVMSRGLTDAAGHLHYGAWYKAFLGWIPTQDLVALRPAASVQEIRLFRHDHPGAAGTRLVTIAQSSTQEYTLEYRAGNIDNPLSAKSVLLGRGRRLAAGLDNHEVIDTKPLVAQRLSLFEGGLSLGRTFSDPSLALHVTPLRTGGEGSGAYVDVAVAYGASTGNRLPVASIRTEGAVLQPGQSFTFSVQASDPDGDMLAYNWDFSDGTQGESAASITKPFSTAGGSLRASCVVSDRRGGRVTVTQTVPVGENPLRTWQPVTTPATATLRSIAYGGGRFVAVGDAGAVLISDDLGATWRQTNGPARALVVRYVNGRFILIVGDAIPVLGRSALFQSNDGTVWQAIPVPAAQSSFILIDVAFGLGRYAFAAARGVVSCKADFTDWRQQIIPLAESASTGGRQHLYLAAIGFWGDRFIAAGAFSNGGVSLDGVNWDFNNSDQGSVVTGLGRIGGRWIGARQLVNGISTSDDGLRWGALQLVQQGERGANAIATIGDVGVSVAGKDWYGTDGGNGEIAIFSSELVDFVQLPAPVARSLRGVAYGGGRFVAVGDMGLVLRSGQLPSNTTVLANLSTRTGTSDATPLITGFAIQGLAQKTLLIRVTGPALAGFNVEGTIADPVLEIYKGDTLLMQNDNWSESASAELTAAVAPRVSAFPIAPGSRDSALVVTLDPGSYTAAVRGVNSGEGVALVEIYDADSSGYSAARLSNLSARADVGVDEKILVVGLSVSGTQRRTYLVRAIGPTLSSFNVPGVLADPRLEVLTEGGRSVASNDNWGGGAQLASTFAQLAAFPLDAAAKDSALIVTLDPGSYTVQVSGVGRTTGSALVEVYEVP